MFRGMEFYVVNTNAQLVKQDLELLIHQHGGYVVQNLLQTTTHLVAN
jgi:hypothetical protein